MVFQGFPLKSGASVGPEGRNSDFFRFDWASSTGSFGEGLNFRIIWKTAERKYHIRFICKWNVLRSIGPVYVKTLSLK